MLARDRHIQLAASFYDEYHRKDIPDAPGIDRTGFLVDGLTVNVFDILAFNNELANFNSDLINSVNSFSVSIDKLLAWKRVMDSTNDEEEQIDLAFEELIPGAQRCMDFPYAIKNSTAYYAIALMEIAFRVTKDNCPKYDKFRIKVGTLNQFAKVSSLYGWPLADLIEALESVDTGSFREQTNQYRIRRHHRAAPYVEIGERPLFQYWSDGKAKGYTFGTERALSIDDLSPVLLAELEGCIRIHNSFWHFAMGVRATLLQLHPANKLNDESINHLLISE